MQALFSKKIKIEKASVFSAMSSNPALIDQRKDKKDEPFHVSSNGSQ
jgi:hypothetical protein